MATDQSKDEISARLSRFVADCRWRDLPEPVRREAKRSLVNFFATSFAGCHEPPVEKAVHLLRPFTASATASIVGRSERMDVFNAAFVNAMSANVFDFDDTHPNTIIHPTAPVAPALFAFAETYAMTGEDLLLAFVLGAEAEVRIGNAISPGHYRRGWHITSTCGVFGSALAIGKALALDAQRLIWTIGNASVQTGGLVETLGTMAKSISVGNAAKNGLLAALLARDGFSGPDHPLEGEHGFLRVVTDEPKFDAVCDRLGEQWELLSNTYKPYPCGVVLNPVVEACIALARDSRLSASRTSSASTSSAIRCSVNGPIALACGRAARRRSARNTPLPSALTRAKAGLPNSATKRWPTRRCRTSAAR